MKDISILNKTFKVIEILLKIFVILLLTVYSYVLIMSKIQPQKIPAIFGYKPFIVMTGSMSPEINKGDLILVKEMDYSKLKSGDIIAFKNSHNKVIIHRIEQIDNSNEENKYITKGDNNNIVDEGYILKENIEGIYTTKFSKIGNILLFIRKPLGLIICILSIIIISLSYILIKNYKKLKW